MDSDLLMQKVNRYNGIMARGTRIYPILLRLILMQLESLTEIWKSSNNSDKDKDDMYFPTLQELIARRCVSRGHAPKAVNKPALDDDHSISPNLGDSQGECTNSSLL
jgi:hypothetical protein